MEVVIKGDRAVALKLEQMGPRASLQAVRTVAKLALQLQRKVVRDKLTGQALNVRTGTLRRSIDQMVVQQSSHAVLGVVSTNLEYARAHEYGLKGQQSVRAHLRTITQAFGRSISPKAVEVRGHSRAVALPERSFLRSALRDMEPEIVAELQKAVMDELTKGAR